MLSSPTPVQVRHPVLQPGWALVRASPVPQVVPKLLELARRGTEQWRAKPVVPSALAPQEPVRRSRHRQTTPLHYLRRLYRTCSLHRGCSPLGRALAAQ